MMELLTAIYTFIGCFYYTYYSTINKEAFESVFNDYENKVVIYFKSVVMFCAILIWPLLCIITIIRNIVIKIKINNL